LKFVTSKCSRSTTLWHIVGLVAVFVPLTGLLPIEAAAQADRNEIAQRLSALEAAVQKLAADITQLSTLLRTSMPPPPPGPVEEVPSLTLAVADAAALGSPAAEVAIVEYSDFQCPFCGRHARDVFPIIKRELIDTGQVRYVYRHLPIENIHPLALRAGEAAECARAPGQFWAMHDRLFANQEALAESDLIASAKILGLEQSAFTSCLSGGVMTARVKRDQAEARRIGIAATPSLLVGRLAPDGGVQVRLKITGAQPFPTIRAAVQRILGEQPDRK
jgi:protein-disulfide isomerase